MLHATALRKHIMKVKAEENLTFAGTAKRFKISMRSLFRWQKNIEAKRTRNKPPSKIDEERLRRHVEEYPDAYLRERAALFGVSESAIRKAFKRMGITRKKNTRTSQSRTSSGRTLQRRDRKPSQE